MKKLILFTAMAAAATAFADIKIGTVDMMSLVRNHSSYAPNRKLLAETEKDYTKKLDAMKEELDEIQEEGKSMTDQLRNPLLSQGSKTKLEKDLVDVQNKFIAAQQRIRAEMLRSQQDLQDLEGRLLKATTEDLREKINAFAAKNKYDLIIDVTTTPFASEALDVTPAILKAMGVDPENTVEKQAEKAEKAAAEKKSAAENKEAK